MGQTPYGNGSSHGYPRRGFGNGSTRSKGQTLVRVCLGSALLVSFVLGGSAYVSLSSIEPLSADPFSVAAGALMLAGIAAVGSLVVAVMSAVAVHRADPKKLAWLALVLSIVLPVITLVSGVYLGVQELWEMVTTNGEVVSRIADSATGFAGTILDKILKEVSANEVPLNW